jgi:hypothetical protein
MAAQYMIILLDFMIPCHQEKGGQLQHLHQLLGYST